MEWYKDTLEIATRGKGLYPFTELVERKLKSYGMREGLCYLFCLHTSASLIISENCDPTARFDLETFMDRLVPEDLAWYRHTMEGSDDSPSHVRSMLTNADLVIPVDHGRLCLGTWQGIYLFEHRHAPERRQVLVRFLGV